MEHPSVQQLARDLTVIVPAFNEASSVADTVRSIQAQTVRIREILVVDDCSTDDTGEVARACGAVVFRPPVNTGSKAGAQNFALQHVHTEFAMEEAQRLADRVVIIDHGKVIADDTVAGLTRGGGSLESVFLSLTGRSLRD